MVTILFTHDNSLLHVGPHLSHHEKDGCKGHCKKHKCHLFVFSLNEARPYLKYTYILIPWDWEEFTVHHTQCSCNQHFLIIVNLDTYTIFTVCNTWNVMILNDMFHYIPCSLYFLLSLTQLLNSLFCSVIIFAVCITCIIIIIIVIIIWNFTTILKIVVCVFSFEFTNFLKINYSLFSAVFRQIP